MAHGDLAQIAALLGAAGSVGVLAVRGRVPLFAGFGLLVAAEAALAVALVPGSDLSRLDSPLRLGGLLVMTLLAVALGAALSRFPAVVPVLLLAAAPFRIPVDLGTQHAFLLLPLYGVLAAASIGLLARAARGPVPDVLPLLALPAAALIAFDAVSLLWAQDLQQGSIELAFFVFPFATLVAVVARSPYEDWLPRALATTLVALACVFAAIGIWQEWTKTVFFAHDLRVANTYASFFRVTSVFKDPSIYGRHLALAIVVLVVVLWLGKVRFWVAAAAVALIFAGLYFSYSQSSMAVLFVGVLLATLVLGDGRARKVVLVAALVAALAGGAVAATTAKGHSLRKATSGRSRLVTVTTRVIENHPLVGVGVGSQPLASSREAKSRLAARRDASHTTPLTVLAELGVVGFLLYLTFLAAAVRLLFLTARTRRAFGLGLAAAFCVFFLHSLFYSGFFEDPLMWGTLAVAAASLATVPVRETETEPGPTPQRAPHRVGPAPAAEDAGGR
jgi:putative inorganic carbon (hco3(-)) transporter